MLSTLRKSCVQSVFLGPQFCMRRFTPSEDSGPVSPQMTRLLGLKGTVYRDILDVLTLCCLSADASTSSLPLDRNPGCMLAAGAAGMEEVILTVVVAYVLFPFNELEWHLLASITPVRLRELVFSIILFVPTLVHCVPLRGIGDKGKEGRAHPEHIFLRDGALSFGMICHTHRSDAVCRGQSSRNKRSRLGVSVDSVLLERCMTHFRDNKWIIIALPIASSRVFLNLMGLVNGPRLETTVRRRDMNRPAFRTPTGDSDVDDDIVFEEENQSNTFALMDGPSE